MLLLKLLFVLIVVFMAELALFYILCGCLALFFRCNLFKVDEIRHRENCTAPMKFDHWFDIYCLNPDNWNISNSLPSIWDTGYTDDNGQTICSGYYIYVNLKGIDLIRYSVFAYKSKENKKSTLKKKAERVATISVLQYAEKEIAKIKEQSQKEIEQSAQETKKIREKLLQSHG